jgi:prepilin-type N-terminal cleavage/methylation domain-containing protein/prepilin-type processing-associated H-X9-DG protein
MTISGRKPQAFTLIELLVTIGIIAILASLLLPALSRAKAKSNQIQCLNDIRQLNVAAAMYVGDHDNEYPARRRLTNSWIFTLQSYYKNPAILKCPRDRNTRTYIMNGWNDYWKLNLDDNDYKRVMRWLYPHGMKQTSIPFPSETIIFGEKKPTSKHVHVDFAQGRGDDRDQVHPNMHGSGKSGGSNFAFVDGSARLLPYDGSIKPHNLWAVTAPLRDALAERQ